MNGSQWGYRGLLVLAVVAVASLVSATRGSAIKSAAVLFVPTPAGSTQGQPAQPIGVAGTLLIPGHDLPLPASPTVKPAPAVPDDSLAAAIEGALEGYRDACSVAVYRPRDGRSAVYDPDRVYYAASTFKLAVLYEAERRLAAGELALDDRIVITEADATEDLGTLGEVPIADDGSVSVADALYAMVTISDNATAVAFLHHFGGANVDATLAAIGAPDFDVNTTDLPVTAAALARVMTAIVTGEGLDFAAREHARTLLLAQTWRDGIPAGLPAGVAVGNKTGTWPGATHDVAFVDAPGGTYVLAVLCELGWDFRPHARVSEAVYAVLAAP